MYIYIYFLIFSIYSGLTFVNAKLWAITIGLADIYGVLWNQKSLTYIIYEFDGLLAWGRSVSWLAWNSVRLQVIGKEEDISCGVLVMTDVGRDALFPWIWFSEVVALICCSGVPVIVSTDQFLCNLLCVALQNFICSVLCVF